MRFQEISRGAKSLASMDMNSNAMSMPGMSMGSNGSSMNMSSSSGMLGMIYISSLKETRIKPKSLGF